MWKCKSLSFSLPWLPWHPIHLRKWDPKVHFHQVELLLDLRRWINQRFFNITIETGSSLTFLKIPASKKSDFQSMSVRLVNFNGRSGCSGGGWRCSGWGLRLTLDSCRFCSFAIVDSPPVKSAIQLSVLWQMRSRGKTRKNGFLWFKEIYYFDFVSYLSKLF